MSAVRTVRGDVATEELVDFYLPRIRPLVKKRLTVIVGDAFEVLPTPTADVALLDMFPGIRTAKPDDSTHDHECSPIPGAEIVSFHGPSKIPRASP